MRDPYRVSGVGGARWKLVATVLVILVLIALLAPFPPAVCPSGGAAVFPSIRALALLKNRVALPEQADFDDRVTLASLLEPGDDRTRWSNSRAAAIEGYVVDVGTARIESANCYSVANRDVHVHVAMRPDAPEREHLIVEVTPRLRERAEGQGSDWSTAALEARFLGRWCRIEGWLLFDTEHVDESEHTAPGAPDNWRGTTWEIHPVTKIEVVRLTAPRR